MAGFWTDERKALAEKLWLEGMSASLIAKRLTESIDRKTEDPPSRSAVIGILHRMKINERAGASPPPDRIRNNPAARAAKAGTTPKERPRPQNQPRKAAPEPGFEPAPREKFVARPRPTDGSPLPPRVEMPKRPEALTEIRLTDLKPGMCKWPIGDPFEVAFCFCGGKVESPEPDAPYCPRHERIAFVPPPAPRKHRRGAGELVRGLRRYI